MTDLDTASIQITESTTSPSRTSSIMRPEFVTSRHHIQFADQVFRKDIDVVFSGKALGTWVYENYQVDQQTKAAIVFVHGFGEHQGRYISIADVFAKHGFQVLLYDQRGSGRSGGHRGETTIELMHRDLDLVLQYVDRQLPVFCYGHSLGAAIVTTFCQVNPSINFQGVITTNAYLNIPERYNLPKILLLRVIRRILPTLLVNLYPNYSHNSKNNYHIKKLAEDQLLQQQMTVKTAYEITQLCSYLQQNQAKFTTPILMVHGKLDRISSHMASVEFYGKCGSSDRTLKIFEYGYHELHADTERERLQQLTLTWCLKQLEKGTKLTNFSSLNHGLKRSYRVNYKRVLVVLFVIILISQRKCIRNFSMLLSKSLMRLMIRN